jgi:hypothetical protein
VRLTWVAALPALGLLACVALEHREVSTLRGEHTRCVADHSEAHPDCVALRDRLDAAERRYQENSRRAWSCDPAQESCPTPR